MGISKNQYFKITGKKLPIHNKRNKYNSQKVNGYDSKKESTRAGELRMWQKLGIISELKEQVKFVLQESFKIPSDKTKQGFETIPSINYFADFTYKKPGKEKLFVEDVKGFKTQVYNIKKKLLIKRYQESIIFLET